MNLNRVISIPNGTTALTFGQRVAIAVQNGIIVVVPAGTAAGAIGTVMRDVAAGSTPPAGTTANGLGTYSTADINCFQGIEYGQVDSAISAGAALYGQTGGLLTGTATGSQVGIALETSLEAGDCIRYIPIPYI